MTRRKRAQQKRHALTWRLRILTDPPSYWIDGSLRIDPRREGSVAWRVRWLRAEIARLWGAA